MRLVIACKFIMFNKCFQIKICSQSAFDQKMKISKKEFRKVSRPMSSKQQRWAPKRELQELMSK